MTERDEPDLDEELRRLFADDRLDLPVARNASAAVVAGARRRRRNRVALTAAGGVLAVVAVVFAGLALSGIGRPTTVPAAAGPVLTMTVPTATPTASTPTIAPQPAGDALYVLGPDGYEKLMLGMPLSEATAAGLFGKTASTKVSAGCLRYTMLINEMYVGPTLAGGAAPSMPVKGTLEVLVSLRDGVAELNGDPLLRSPEGIGVGAPEEMLVQAYPQLYVSRGTATAQVSGNPKAVYVFGLTGAGTVTSFSLRLAKSDCPG
jgi:hypothetical protein